LPTAAQRVSYLWPVFNARQGDLTDILSGRNGEFNHLEPPDTVLRLIPSGFAVRKGRPDSVSSTPGPKLVFRNNGLNDNSGRDCVALKIVGSGLGRTGTKSLQSALNMLGFGPCHHMVEVFAHPESAALWIEAAAGRPDWDAIFAGYQAMVDYPGAHYWRQLAAYYPHAKVLHTVRDPDDWFESTQATIFAPDGPTKRQGPMSEFFASFMGEFRARMHERAFMTGHFRRHTEAVKQAIPPQRLLVYEAGQGWEPLCRFLDVPIPKEPYPSENSRAEFIARVRSGQGGPPR
jgi:hypothetical protein